jgi:hypothetical protein
MAGELAIYALRDLLCLFAGSLHTSDAGFAPSLGANGRESEQIDKVDSRCTFCPPLGELRTGEPLVSSLPYRLRRNNIDMFSFFEPLRLLFLAATFASLPFCSLSISSLRTRFQYLLN